MANFVASPVLLAVLSAAFIVLTNGEISSAKRELDLFRLTNAIHPYRKEIRSYWSRRPTTTQEEAEPVLTCHLCQAVMPLLKQWTEEYPPEVLTEMVVSACKLLELAPRPSICEPIITAYTKQFLYVISQTSESEDNPLPSTQICGILTPNCDHPGLPDLNVTIAGNKPDVEDRTILNADSSETTKIIQFTDLHVDLDYVPGTTTDCGKGMPICCRVEEGYPGENQTHLRAGPYGDFHCALPIDTLKLMFQNARETTPDAKYIFLTGDYIHSGVWLYNKTENGRHHKAVTEALAAAFPEEHIKIYPLTGNHEPQVVNMYPPKDLWETEEDFDLYWLYETILTPFVERDMYILPVEETERFLAGGYYSVTPEDDPTLRIVVINTNVCSPENFWLGFTPYPDIKRQLDWLAKTLKDAEDAKQSVLIVGHIEPGNCYPAWSAKFHEIVARFEGIIRGSFFGHSHKPQYRVALEKGTERPVFSSYIAGSGLPDLMNPGYSVWHVDGARGKDSKWDVLRHELFIMNLKESNEKKEPVFRKLTDSYETLGLPNLRPESVLEFGKRMICNQPLVDSFLTFHTKGDDSLDHRACVVYNATCMEGILCNVVSSNAADKNSCKTLKSLLAETKCPTSAGTKLDTQMYGLVALVMLGLVKYAGF